MNEEIFGTPTIEMYTKEEQLKKSLDNLVVKFQNLQYDLSQIKDVLENNKDKLLIDGMMEDISYASINCNTIRERQIKPETKVDDLAETKLYFAKKFAEGHAVRDPGVEDVYYLPTDSPNGEIRLLETNLIIADWTPLVPLDFGITVNGQEFYTLYVLDITPSQLQEIIDKKLELPEGWSLKNMEKLVSKS